MTDLPDAGTENTLSSALLASLVAARNRRLVRDLPDAAVTAEAVAAFTVACAKASTVPGATAGDCPVRQRSLKGIPQPETSIERTCRTCGASFVRTAPGKTHERGIWRDWTWFCSVECDPKRGVS